MIDQLHRKPGSAAIRTTIGDFAETVVDGEFSLVYVVFNSIGNLVDQAEWVQTFRNAARHLQPGGRFPFTSDSEKSSISVWERH